MRVQIPRVGCSFRHRFAALYGQSLAFAIRGRCWECDREQRPGAVEIVGIAGSQLKGEGPPLIVAEGVDLGRPAAARAPDGMTEGPPFAPAAER